MPGEEWRDAVFPDGSAGRIKRARTTQEDLDDAKLSIFVETQRRWRPLISTLELFTAPSEVSAPPRGAARVIEGDGALCVEAT